MTAEETWVCSGLQKALQFCSHCLVSHGFKCQDKSFACPAEFSIIVRNQLHLNQVPQPRWEVIHSSGRRVPISQRRKSCRFLWIQSQPARRPSRFRLVPVLTQPALPQPPLALGLVLVRELRRQQRRLPELAARFVVLPGVPLALAGGDHGDFVRSRAAVLALKLDALGAGLVVDTPPVLAAAAAAAAAPATPELPAVGAADPVLEHLSRETLAGAHQLLDGVNAGAVAIGDILSGPELSAADLAPFCGKTQ